MAQFTKEELQAQLDDAMVGLKFGGNLNRIGRILHENGYTFRDNAEGTPVVMTKAEGAEFDRGAN